MGNFDGKPVYQYVMGMNPSLDGSANANAGGAGLLAAGTITFSSSGQIQDMTMFTPPEGGDTSNLSAWIPAGFDASGNPAFTATFSGAGPQSISLILGMEMIGGWTKGYANAAEANANPEQVYTGPGRALLASSSASYNGNSGTVSSTQDGYAPGYLEDLTISRDGMMAGQYSNGQTMDLFQIPIYRFINEEGLRHEGGNRYTDTPESGNAEIGLPNTENYGGLLEASLEQSNVDMATEFTTMIITQRGFQMNSKVVTTSDQLLQKALELKR